MSNKKDITTYNARHRLPNTGKVRTLDGQEWTGRGGFWHIDKEGTPALSATQLSEQHRPLIVVSR